MTRSLASLALALALVATLTVTVAASDRRPVRGQFTGSVADVDQRCPGALTIGFELDGVLSHLGRITGTGSNCTTFTLGSEAVPIWDGIAVLTAADGSTLTVAYDGSQGVPTNGVATFSHADTVIGGTGRFDGATGEFAVSGLIDLGNLTVTGSVSGWIDY
jgi:hypothetical protein